jgi:alcohol dehydrogenase YqhD (iron-dependent ADH family)
MREIQEKIHSVREFEVSVVNESDLLKRLRLEEHKISLLKRRAEENHIVVLGRKRRIQEKNRKEIAHGI